MSGRVVHFEVPVDIAERAASFYRDTFGWSTTSIPEMNYTLVSTGPGGDQGPTEPGYIGGGLAQRGGPVTAPVVTVEVDNIDDALASVLAHGGTVVQTRTSVGGMGWTAYFTDTEGNVMGMWQTNPGQAEEGDS